MPTVLHCKRLCSQAVSPCKHSYNVPFIQSTRVLSGVNIRKTVAPLATARNSCYDESVKRFRNIWQVSCCSVHALRHWFQVVRLIRAPSDSHMLTMRQAAGCGPGQPTPDLVLWGEWGQATISVQLCMQEDRAR